MRTKFETIRLDFSSPNVIAPGIYHDEGKWQGNECQEPETDDGCDACQQEMEEAGEEIFRRFSDSGREVMNLMLVNNPPDDGYWEFEVWSRLQKEGQNHED